MKKLALSFFIITVFLMACSSNNQDDGVIKEAKLTEFEKNLLSLSGEASFIHDVEINNDQVNEIYLYIDLYKDGKHIGVVSEIGSGISEENFKTVFLNLPPTETERRWVSAVMAGGGYASGNGANKLDEEYQSSAWGSVNGEISLSIGKKQPIATLIYSNQDSISIIDDLSAKEAFEKQTSYEEVYIFSVELR